MKKWAFHAQTKDGIDFVFARAVEVISDSIHKCSSFKQKNIIRDTILFQEQMKSDESSGAEDENSNINFSNRNQQN